MVLRADAPSGARLARETSALAASQTRTTQAPPRQPALLERKGRVECYDFRRCAPLSTCDCLPRSGSHLRSPCAKRTACHPAPARRRSTPPQHTLSACARGRASAPRVLTCLRVTLRRRLNVLSFASTSRCGAPRAGAAHPCLTRTGVSLVSVRTSPRVLCACSLHVHDYLASLQIMFRVHRHYTLLELHSPLLSLVMCNGGVMALH